MHITNMVWPCRQTLLHRPPCPRQTDRQTDSKTDRTNFIFRRNKNCSLTRLHRVPTDWQAPKKQTGKHWTDRLDSQTDRQTLDRQTGKQKTYSQENNGQTD
jgi:hypothetical protein